MQKNLPPSAYDLGGMIVFGISDAKERLDQTLAGEIPVAPTTQSFLGESALVLAADSKA